MKPGLPLERHIEVGRRLDELHVELQTLSVEVSRAYPVNSVQVRRLSSTCDRLNAARSALDDAVIREHEQGCAHVYYPGREEYELPHRCGTSGRGRGPSS